MKLTEEQFNMACDIVGCHRPVFHKVLGEYANLPAYLRIYCELWNKNLSKITTKEGNKIKDKVYDEISAVANASKIPLTYREECLMKAVVDKVIMEVNDHL